MKIQLLLMLTGLLPAVALSAPPATGKQTTAGAQKFISAMLQSRSPGIKFGRYNSYSFHPIVRHSGEPFASSFSVEFPGYTLTGVASEGDCVTLFELNGLGSVKSWRDKDYPDLFKPVTALPPPFTDEADLARAKEAADARWRVNWGDVTEVAFGDYDKSTVRISGLIGNVALGDHKISTSMSFTLPDQSIAARVAYAMDFLRTRCDNAAATGF